MREGSLSELGGLRIAVDVLAWIRQVKLPVLESLSPCTGGLPLSFSEAITSQLAQWQAANIVPLFVFEGLSIVRDPTIPWSMRILQLMSCD